MRSYTLEIANFGLACFVNLHFEGGDIIVGILALNEDSAMAALREATKGRALRASPPLPVATIYDQEGLRSLTLEQLEQATRTVATFEFDFRTGRGEWREENAK